MQGSKVFDLEDFRSVDARVSLASSGFWFGRGYCEGVSVFALVVLHFGNDMWSDREPCVLVFSLQSRLPSRLDVVLRYLLLPPFGTLGEASFRDLTRLTLVLLALSTTEGVSELHSYQLTWVSGEVMRYSRTC